MKIPLIKPYIDDDIKNDVMKVLDSGYLTEGPVTKEFESKFSDFVDAKYSIAVTSCTTGLEMALRALNIGHGDEVIVPDFTYPATAGAVNIVGATAVIVDINEDTMLIDYNEIINNISSKTKALIPVSEFGNPLNYEILNKIKTEHNLFIIEDSACSVGAEYNGTKIGTFADISVFSFHPRKFITTGEGGMITTDNENWANWMNSYKHFGMKMNGSDRAGVQFDIQGTNYKLSNIQSALGLGQLKKIDSLLSKRRELANNYISLLKKYKTIIIPETTEKGLHSYQSFCIFIDNRDMVMKAMREKGIEVQIGTYSLHEHKAFYDNSLVRLTDNYKNSLYANKHCLTLPLFHDLTFEQQEFIVSELIENL